MTVSEVIATQRSKNIPHPCVPIQARNKNRWCLRRVVSQELLLRAVLLVTLPVCRESAVTCELKPRAARMF